MARVQLLADTQYFSGFSTYLSSVSGVELVSDQPDVILDATFLDPVQKLASLAKLANSSAVIISNTLTISATAAQAACGATFHLIGAPLFPGYFDRQSLVEIAVPYGHTNGTGKATEFFELLGKKTEIIKDSVGGVFPRTLAMIINEAAFAVQEQIASIEDIDTAMKLGTNYPKGPLAWCDEIGAGAVLAVLDALAREYGEDRYRAATLLRRNAEARLPFYQRELAAA